MEPPIEVPVLYADATDYENRAYAAEPWTDSQLEFKLGEASRMIRDQAPQTDARILAGQLDLERVKDIVCAMVSRAKPLTDLGIPMGTESAQIGVDIFQKTVRFGQNAGAGALYFSKSERKTLGIGQQRIWSIDLTSENPS